MVFVVWTGDFTWQVSFGQYWPTVTYAGELCQHFSGWREKHLLYYVFSAHSPTCNMTSAYEHGLVLLCWASTEEGKCCTVLCFFLPFLMYCIPLVTPAQTAFHWSHQHRLCALPSYKWTALFFLLLKKSIWHRTEMSSRQVAFIDRFLILQTFSVTPGK